MKEYIWSPRGRLSRWNYFLVMAIFSVVVIVAGLSLKISDALTIPVILIFIFCAWVQFCAAARRLHDIGHSGWISLLFFIPIVNVALELYLLFTPGESCENKYGPIPIGKTKTYGSAESKIGSSSISAAPHQSMIDVLPGGIQDEEIYWAQALQELEGPERRQGLWAIAFAKAKGDENRAKADYLEKRVDQLKSERAESLK